MYLQQVEFACIAVFMLTKVALLNKITQLCKSDKGVAIAV